MIDVQNFLATAIRRITRRKPVTVLLVNSPDGMDENDTLAGGVKYRREIFENVEAFRKRAADDAEKRGEVSIIFGASEDEDQ